MAEERAPRWLQAWSPLSRLASLPRELPHNSITPASLLLPGPRVGSFWTAGNPAGLRDELEDSRSDFALGWDRSSGAYRRPLDPGAGTSTHGSAAGWKPMNPRFGVLGRFQFERGRLDPGTQAAVDEPYPTNPFVTLDTAPSAMRRTRVNLAAVGSWRFGGLAAGLALGYETLTNETVEAGFVRRTRQTVPGVTVGAIGRIGSSLRLGTYARYRNRAETLRFLELAGQGKVIQLEGLREVPRLDIIGGYFRRMEEDAGSAGLSASGSFGTAKWAAYGERTALRERLFRQETDEPASDRWNADGWAMGGAFQRPLGGRRLVTVEARYVTLDGDGDLALDSAGVVFRATESDLTANAEFRVLPDTLSWALVVSAHIHREYRLRNDFSVSLGSRVTGITTGAGLELGRAISPRVFLTGTLAVANYYSNSAFPGPQVLGSIYRTFTLPELEVAARQARPYLAALGATWRASSTTRFWLVVQGERLEPVDPSLTGLGPGGARNAVSVALGATMR